MMPQFPDCGSCNALHEKKKVLFFSEFYCFYSIIYSTLFGDIRNYTLTNKELSSNKNVMNIRFNSKCT